VSIRSNVKLAEAPSYGKTIFSYAADSSGAQDYMAVAQQLIEREGQWPALAGLPKFDPQAKAPLDAEAQAKKEARKAVRPPPPRKKVPSQVAPQPVSPATTASTRPSPNRASTWCRARWPWC
jgi:hypothetical protein